MRILVGTDGAVHSDLAVRTGGLLAEATGGALTLLTIVRQESRRPEGEAVLARARALIPAALTEVRTRVRLGRMAVEIVAEAEEGATDLIVVGEGPQDTITRHLLGPKVRRIISHKPCPILIARGFSRPVRRLLLCEGGREPSLLTRLLDQLAPLLRGVDDLTLLHVMSQIPAAPGLPDWELDSDAETLIERQTPEGLFLAHDIELLTRLNVSLTTKVRHGLVVPEILAEAESGGYDLVVIGAHESHGWERFLLDDLSMAIVNQGKNPLLIV